MKSYIFQVELAHEDTMIYTHVLNSIGVVAGSRVQQTSCRRHSHWDLSSTVSGVYDARERIWD
jgi:hypothetical protein